MNDKQSRVSSILFAVSSVCFYIIAAIEFFSGDSTSMGAMHICLGSLFLCLSAVNMNRDKTKDEEKDKDKDKDKEEQKKSRRDDR